MWSDETDHQLDDGADRKAERAKKKHHTQKRTTKKKHQNNSKIRPNSHSEKKNVALTLLSFFYDGELLAICLQHLIHTYCSFN